MPTVRKALPEDFQSVYPLLQSFNNRVLTKDDWRNLFVDHWRANRGYCGYILMDEQKTVGYIGALFSIRNIEGKQRQFCNISSWVVEPQYRSSSISLIVPFISLKETTLTTIAPTKQVLPIWTKLGFKPMDTHVTIITPIPDILALFKGIRLESDLHVMEQQLDEHSRFTLQTHRNLNVRHFLINSPAGNCYIMAARSIRTGIPLAHILHLSDPGIFSMSIGAVKMRLMRSMKVMGLFVDNRHLAGHKVRLSINYLLPTPRLCYNAEVEAKDISNAFTDLTILTPPMP